MSNMAKKEKQLLMVDLCARLPYHPTIQIYNDCWEGCRVGEFDNTMGFHHVEAFLCDRIEILPYLRPMSSMTEEERKEFDTKFHICTKLIEHYFAYAKPIIEIYQESIDWLNSHHFDYRGLIPMGLALEAPKDMYKFD